MDPVIFKILYFSDLIKSCIMKQFIFIGGGGEGFQLGNGGH